MISLESCWFDYLIEGSIDEAQGEIILDEAPKKI